MMILIPRAIDMLFEINKKKYITRKTCETSFGAMYYFLTYYLRKKGLIELAKVDGKTKYWKLSKKGKKVVQLLNEIMEVIEE